MYQTLADAVLLLHAGVVAFVIGGLLLVLVGGARGWQWVRARSFRWLHLAAIGVVVLESWAGLTCPLTTIESWLRQQAGQEAYSRGFIDHWVGSLLFYEAPAWVFTVLYTGFAVLVLAAWRIFPPLPPPGRSRVPAAAPAED